MLGNQFFYDSDLLEQPSSFDADCSAGKREGPVEQPVFLVSSVITASNNKLGTKDKV